MSTYSTARSTLFVFKITSAIVICAVLLASLMALFPKMIHAEPLADGVYGYVMNESEEFVEGATIQIACGEGSWVNLAETDENGEYAVAGAGFDESMSFAGCSDEEELRIRATAEGYIPSEGEPLGIIELEEAETLGEWAERILSPVDRRDFFLEVSNIPADGWYGYVIDDESEDPISGAVLTIMCTTQEIARELATTDEDGYYESSLDNFEANLNSAACYYDNEYTVEITISAEGYEDEVMVIEGVVHEDLAATFGGPEQQNFSLSLAPVEYKGSGTEEDPYIIETVEQMNALNSFAEEEGYLYFALGSDVVYEGNQESIYNFYHHLDGRGYSISGGDKTLFEVLEGDAVVQNLSVDADISDSNSGVGVLAGVMKDDARVENVQTSGSIDITCGPGSTCRDVGGIVGAMNHSSYIYRSSASVPLTSSGVDVYYFGGLVGFIYGGSVEESYATGNVEASSGVGGLVGAMIGDSSTSRVSDSYATGDVHARGNFFSVSGGFVGAIDGGTITRSYSIGLATASTTAPGGFAGTLYGASVMIENSFTTALDVQIVNGGYMGGFAGGIYEGQVRNSAWVLIPDVDAVGLVGEEAACSIGNSKEYLIGEGLCNYGYDMGSASVFTFDGYFNGEGYVMAPIYEDGEESWDFENVWAIDEEGESNGGLPYLRWAVVDDNEEEQEEQEEEAPPAKKGGGSSSGSRSGASFSAVQQPAQTLEGIVNQYRDLLLQAVSVGISLPQNILDLLGVQTPTLPVRDLEFGMEGEDVRMLQSLLIGQGYSIPAGATGFFANQTRSALAAYQAANNINPPAGYFGPITRAFMKAAGLPGLWW